MGVSAGQLAAGEILTLHGAVQCMWRSGVLHRVQWGNRRVRRLESLVPRRARCLVKLGWLGRQQMREAVLCPGRHVYMKAHCRS